MVSKKITKNDQSEITEEEKQILQQYYNEQHLTRKRISEERTL